MVSSYQQLNMAEKIWQVFGPLGNPFDPWQRHEVLRFEDVKISQLAPIVRLVDGQRELCVMRWGLVPGWFRGDAVEARKFAARTFNARGESLAEKSSFKHAFKSRRCLVLATSFTEHQALPEGGKQKLRLRAQDGEPLCFAGLWERCTVEGEVWETYSIVTTEPNATVRPLHHRMPVILAAAAWDPWLDPATPPQALQDLLVPAPDDLLAVDVA
jgi:putative SOS response-associated peptidase YedK